MARLVFVRDKPEREEGPMTANISPTPLRPADLTEFAQWFDGRYRRRNGRAPAERTIRQRIDCLTAIANSLPPSTRTALTGAELADIPALGGPSAVPLVGIVGDRDQLELLVERMFVAVSSGTIRNRIYALRDYGDYCVALGALGAHCVLKSDVPPVAPPPPVTIYRPEEVELLVNAARGRGLRWWALMAFLADTGRRIGEALSLEWSWFDLNHSPAYIDVPHTKNGDQQYIPLTKRLVHEVFTPENIERLQNEQRCSKPYLRSMKLHPFPWSYSSTYSMFQAHCDRLGIEHRGLHNLRHTSITTRLAAGVPPQAVSALAGHRSLATTMQRYAHATSLDYWRFIEPPEGGAA